MSAVPPADHVPAGAARGATADEPVASAASGSVRSARPRLDPQALVPGTAVGVVSIAAAVLASRLSDAVGNRDRSFLVLPLVELALVGLVSGGWLAALRCRRSPLVHGAAAALCAIVVCCAASVAGHLAGGDDVPWAAIVVWLLLALAAGTAGGLVSLRPQPAGRWRTRR